MSKGLSAKNISSLAKNSSKPLDGLGDVKVSMKVALETAEEFVGKNFSKVVDKTGYTRYISADGKFIARIGWKRGNQRYELNLEKWENGVRLNNFHIVIE